MNRMPDVWGNKWFFKFRRPLYERITSGGLIDTGMDAWFEALKAQGVDKLKGGPTTSLDPASRQIQGIQEPLLTDYNPTSTLFAPGQRSARTGLTFEQQQELESGPMRGLRRARRA